MRPFRLSLLFLNTLLACAGSSAYAEPVPCPSGSAPDPAQQVRDGHGCLRSSPTRFTRRGDKIIEGAVYGLDGHAICILRRPSDSQEDPPAFVYTPIPELDQAIAREKSVTGFEHPSDELCAKLSERSAKLSIPNGDLLNRLQWSAAEGNCSLVIPAKRPGSAEPDAAHPTASYLHGFVMRNLRTFYKSEREMLQRACNAGVGHDFYRHYFIEGTAQHAAPSFRILTRPYEWASVPLTEAFEGTEIKNRIAYCLHDLFPSAFGNMADPTQGAAFWSHSPKGCPSDALTAKILLGKVGAYSSETFCCFKKKP